MNTLSAINDLNRHTKPLADDIKKKFSTVIDSGWFVLGKEVSSFEAEFAKYCGTEHCVSVANGTEALEIALRALDIGLGHAVATVANAGMYSTTAISAVGAAPVFIDIDNTNLTMSLDDLKKKINGSHLSAIIVTHLYGQLANIEDIVDLANKNGLPVIEDCAQSHGARRSGKTAGSFGTIGCFSFYPTKNLGALGDGGAITTNDKNLKEKILLLRQYGWDKKYHVIKAGCKNSRLDELQATVLNIKLPLLDNWNKRRRQIVQNVSSGCKNLQSIVFPYCADESYVGHLFIVRTPDRNKLRDFLKSKSISSEVHYPIPDHRQPVFQDRYKSLSLPNTEKASGEILTLPCFPEMTDQEVEYIVKSLIEFEECCL